MVYSNIKFNMGSLKLKHVTVGCELGGGVLSRYSFVVYVVDGVLKPQLLWPA